MQWKGKQFEDEGQKVKNKKLIKSLKGPFSRKKNVGGTREIFLCSPPPSPLGGPVNRIRISLWASVTAHECSLETPARIFLSKTPNTVLTAHAEWLHAGYATEVFSTT